eukprot:6376407-Prymnesium_polylepis.2
MIDERCIGAFFFRFSYTVDRGPMAHFLVSLRSPPPVHRCTICSLAICDGAQRAGRILVRPWASILDVEQMARNLLDDDAGVGRVLVAERVALLAATARVAEVAYQQVLTHAGLAPGFRPITAKRHPRAEHNLRPLLAHQLGGVGLRHVEPFFADQRQVRSEHATGDDARRVEKVGEPTGACTHLEDWLLGAAELVLPPP